jgi:hypothetical protein
VRRNATKTLMNALPILKSLVGEPQLEKLIARFLEESPPTTRFLRAVPQEFVPWAQGLADPPHAAFAELVHWEVVELEVLQAPDAEPGARPARPSRQNAIETCPSARLLAYAFPVHGLKRGADKWPAASRTPSFLVAHRVGDKMHWVSVPVVVAKTLVAAAAVPTLGDALDAVRAEAGDAVDEAFVRSWLVNLQKRGAILGFPPPDDA